jgi:serine/threonine protein kinase
MEYVEGTYLDAYCDQRFVSVQDRLKLFVYVCDAVAYAHRNLVVHLDLKPSNILVTDADGTVKLLDFGTSKLIQPDSLLTTTVMATPAYASPEQLRNEAVTAVWAIYALGAILFELLAGRRPNLDSSVAIQRYLVGRPILARPQTTTYRIGKFIRRNRKSVVVGVLAVLALTGTSAYALWRQEQSVRAGRRAEQMQNFMYRLLKLANSNYMGKPAATVEDFLQLGVRVLPDFIKDPADLRAAKLSLAGLYSITTTSSMHSLSSRR